MNHDSGYKLLFSHAEMVADLLRGFVHEDWVAQLDFATLEKCNGSYVSEQWRQREDDVVWRVRFRDEWLYVYVLLEFQSTPDRWMALRMLAYVALLYQDLVRAGQSSRTGRLPPVLPLVLYNGLPAWTAPLSVDELIERVPGGLAPYRPSLRYLLLDEGRLPLSEPEALENLAGALFRMEQSRAPADLLPVLRMLNRWLRAPEQSGLRRAFSAWVRRVLLPGRMPGVDFSQIQDLQEAETMLAERVKQWTEEWKQQGLEEGRLEGRRQGRLEGIQEGRQEGIQEGRHEGKLEAQRTIARALLDVIEDDRLLAARTGLPVADIEAMRRQLGEPE